MLATSSGRSVPRGGKSSLRLPGGTGLLIALTGVVLAAHERRRRRMVGAAQAHHLDARRMAAELAGQHEVAMGADSVVDLLQRAAALVSLASDEPLAGRTNSVGAWKAALAEATRRHALYLDDAVRQWQAAHNLQPDLSAVVRVSLAPQAGTVILSPAQANDLWQRLDQLNLQGDVAVEVADLAEARRPETAVELLVDGSRVTIGGGQGPAEGLGQLVVADAAVGLALHWLWSFATTTQHGQGRTPWTGLLVAGPYAAMVTRWRRVERSRSTAAAGEGLLTCFVLSLASLASLESGVSPPARQPGPAARGRAVIGPVVGYQLARATCSPHLDRASRRMVTAAGLVLGARAWLGMRSGPRAAPAPPVGLAWSIAGSMTLSRAVELYRSLHARRLRQADQDAVEAARELGRHRVARFVAQMADDTQRRLDLAGERLPRKVSDEARRRLEEVRRRLEETEWSTDAGPATGRPWPAGFPEDGWAGALA